MLSVKEADAIETLRRLLTLWYRQGCPWKSEPTLAAFREGLHGDPEIARLVEALILRHGPDMEVRQLRLAHLLDLCVSP